MMAGGQVSLEGAAAVEIQRVSKLLVKRFLKHTGNEGERAVKLVKASS
jgi:hypothetical protein